MAYSNNEILFGVDYYPEQWERQLVEQDIPRIKSFGFNAVRLMEFAWALLEPKEGIYDFSFFDWVIQKCQENNLKVVLGTPTATFPVWLYEKDPEILQEHPTRIKRSFGIRRHACYNSKTYKEAAYKIVEEIAKHYGKNETIIGWQIDNEIAHEGSDVCVCNNCRTAWFKWLENKYENIENLNKIWGTIFWGTNYTRFNQIPMPRTEVASIQNPTLILDYYRFCSDSTIDFVNKQIDILKQYISENHWLTTNLYPTPHYPVTDMEELTKNMDCASFDYYPIWGEQDEPIPYYANSYMLSYIKGLNNRKSFKILEQFSGIQGHTCLGALPDEKQVVLWTNHAIAKGADTIFYFRWRTAKFGQEQLCYGILDPDNKDTSRAQAIRNNIRNFSRNFEQFAGCDIKSDVCLLYDKDNARLLKDQYLSKGLFLQQTPYMQIGYDLELARNYAPYVMFNVNADVKSVKNVNLEQYKLISLPLYQITDPNFVEKLSQWVEAGGNLILTYRTGTRDLNNHATTLELPGLFKKLAGVKVRRFESLNKTQVRIKIGLIPARGEVWADIVETETAKVIGIYSDRKKHYNGTPCFTVNSFGRGRVYYLGTSPDQTGLFFLYRKILKECGLNPKFYGAGIEVIRRKTIDNREVEVVLNHTAKKRKVKGYTVGPYETKIIE